MRVTALTALAVLSTTMHVFAQGARCDAGGVRRTADEARELLVAGVAGDEARETWARVLDCGGAIAWTATLYNVDARATFVFTFARDAIRVYRSQALQPEAAIPWESVREIESGNWVIWFRLHAPVEIASDRGKHRAVKELKVFLHGGDGGELTYYYNERYAGRDWLSGLPVYEVTNLRGIAVGPNAYQRRVQLFLAETFDPGRRITLKHKGKGAGW